jgi:energy-coupling factor transporter ATP-binding protein EcfA2
MNNELVLIFGQPGSGKSTFVNHLLRHCVPSEIPIGRAFVTQWNVPRFANVSPEDDIMELGRPDNGTGFRGSDRLTMNAVTYLNPWLQVTRPPLVLVEGDRFANMAFITWASKLYNVVPVQMRTDDELCAQRRHARFEEKGANWKFKTRKTTGLPNATWVAGRVTKANNLARELPRRIVLDGALEPAVLEQHLLATGNQLAQWLHNRRPVSAGV